MRWDKHSIQLQHTTSSEKQTLARRSQPTLQLASGSPSRRPALVENARAWAAPAAAYRKCHCGLQKCACAAHVNARLCGGGERRGRQAATGAGSGQGHVESWPNKSSWGTRAQSSCPDCLALPSLEVFWLTMAATSHSAERREGSRAIFAQRPARQKATMQRLQTVFQFRATRPGQWDKQGDTKTHQRLRRHTTPAPFGVVLPTK
jgi:hypothetical protein